MNHLEAMKKLGAHADCDFNAPWYEVKNALGPLASYREIKRDAQSDRDVKLGLREKSLGFVAEFKLDRGSLWIYGETEIRTGEEWIINATLSPEVLQDWLPQPGRLTAAGKRNNRWTRRNRDPQPFNYISDADQSETSSPTQSKRSHDFASREQGFPPLPSLATLTLASLKQYIEGLGLGFVVINNRPLGGGVWIYKDAKAFGALAAHLKSNGVGVKHYPTGRKKKPGEQYELDPRNRLAKTEPCLNEQQAQTNQNISDQPRAHPERQQMSKKMPHKPSQPALTEQQHLDKYACLIYILNNEDPNYARGFRYGVDSVDRSRMYTVDRARADELVKAHGLIHVEVAVMVGIRKRLYPEIFKKQSWIPWFHDRLVPCHASNLG